MRVKVGKTIPGLVEMYLTTNDLHNYHISIHTIIWIIEGNYLKVKWRKDGNEAKKDGKESTVQEKDEISFVSLYFPFTPLCSWWLAFHHGVCLVSFLQTGRGFVLSTEIYWDLLPSVWSPVIHPSGQNDINERLLFSCCNLAPNFKMNWRVKLLVAKHKSGFITAEEINLTDGTVFVHPNEL